MRRARYRYTPKRKAALRRAQIVSARKRRGKKVALIGAGVGVLAVGAGAGIVLGVKHKSREGSPIQVIKKTEAPPAAKPENMNVAKETVDKPHKAARRVIVSGSRDWHDADAINKALDKELKKHKVLTVVHGGARGADSLAGAWAKAQIVAGHKVTEEIHPAQWDTHGRGAGPIRNQKMADLGADKVLAFPLGRSPGTRHMIKISRAAGMKVKVLS